MPSTGRREARYSKSGKDGPVLRIVPQGKHQHGSRQLFADRRQVVAIAKVHDVVFQSRLFDGRVHFTVHLADQAQPQFPLEVRIGPGLRAQRLPEVQRIAVGGEKSSVDHVEMAVWFHGLVEITTVIAVRDHGHRRLRLGLELFLHKRRDCQHGGALVQHGLFHRPEPAPGVARHRQVLEVVHPGPRVAEIRDPGNPELLVQPLPDQMHRVGRPCRNNHIDRMFRQIFLQETHARPHPAHAGIRHEQVAADPQRQALLEGLLSAGNLREDARPHPAHARIRHEQVTANPQRQALLEGLLPGRDFRDLALGRPGCERLHVRGCALAHQLAVDVVRLGDGTAEDLRVARNLRLQGMVDGRIFRILRRIDDRLPAFLGQVLGELHPTLDPRSAGRRPVVSDDEDTFHNLQS